MAKYLRVLYDFTAEEEGEMSISVGDVVQFMNNEDDDPKNGWIHVHSTKDAQCGYVPADYLEDVLSSPAAAPPTTIAAPPSAPATSPLPPPASTPATPYAAPKATPTSSPGKLNISSLLQQSQQATTSTTPTISSLLTKSTSTLNKFKSTAKSVQNMVRVTNTVAAPRVPALTAAVERDDFDELIKRNDEYFTRLTSSQADTFDSLTDMVDALSKKLNEATQCSNDLVSKLSELDDLIDEEKRKWKQQNENEKNSDILGRSKVLTSAAPSKSSGIMV